MEGSNGGIEATRKHKHAWVWTYHLVYVGDFGLKDSDCVADGRFLMGAGCECALGEPGQLSRLHHVLHEELR
jgi:hypothetical protein